MEGCALGKQCNRGQLREEFQGDEIGAHSISKHEAIPKMSPGPQGEDVPSTVSASTSDSEMAGIPASSSVPVQFPRRGPGFLTLIGYFTLKIVFILAAVSTLLLLGLYAAKLTGIYDSCEILSMSNEECNATPYLKGLLHHIECTKNKHCFLPGFSSIITIKNWTFKDPANLN